ncbi:hypothetical protein TNCV_1581071 [Trichonephila clavipes]|nr:hypothetical protein TNCV_1581071 [Trichonephila clavipes]
MENGRDSSSEIISSSNSHMCPYIVMEGILVVRIENFSALPSDVKLQTSCHHKWFYTVTSEQKKQFQPATNHIALPPQLIDGYSSRKGKVVLLASKQRNVKFRMICINHLRFNSIEVPGFDRNKAGNSTVPYCGIPETLAKSFFF